MVDRSTIDYWASLFPDGYGSDLVREVPRKLSAKGKGLVGIKRRAAAGSATTERVECLAVSAADAKGVQVEAKLTRADGAVFIVQAGLDQKGNITSFEAEAL